MQSQKLLPLPKLVQQLFFAVWCCPHPNTLDRYLFNKHACNQLFRLEKCDPIAAPITRPTPVPAPMCHGSFVNAKIKAPIALQNTRPIPAHGTFYSFSFQSSHSNLYYA